MRITTKMLSDSFRRAGLPIQQGSLMNYINNQNGSSVGSLLNALPASLKADKKERENYERREKTADELLEHIGKLTETGEKSLFAKCGESGDASEIYKEVEVLVEKYNSLRTDLNTSTDTLDIFYGQNLDELLSEKKELLGSVGITAGKDGKLKIDADKLKSAPMDKMKEAFGEKSDFMEMLQFLAGRVSDYAAANIKNVSGNYSQSGNMNYYQPSKYNFWG